MTVCRPVSANLRGGLHADWLCMVHDTVPAAPFESPAFNSPSVGAPVDKRSCAGFSCIA